MANLTLQAWLAHAQGTIARLDAQVIAQHVLQLSRSQLITQDTRSLSVEEQTLLQALLAQRVAGAPMAYLTGRKEFYGLAFEVSSSVLVPRPETELLVETGLAALQAFSALSKESRISELRALDLGTGSGCVAIALAHLAPTVHVTAVDASAQALEVAKRNAARLTPERVSFVQSDWFDALALSGEKGAHPRFHLILGNPPYIAEGDSHLAALTHEPAMALTSGVDGLKAITHIIEKAPQYLHAGGSLWLEHGYDQAARVCHLLQEVGFKGVSSRADLAGIERITGGVWAI